MHTAAATGKHKKKLICLGVGVWGKDGGGGGVAMSGARGVAGIWGLKTPVALQGV